MIYIDNVRHFSNKDEHLYVVKMQEDNDVFYTSGIPARNADSAKAIAKAEYKNAKIICVTRMS